MDLEIWVVHGVQFQDLACGSLGSGSCKDLAQPRVSVAGDTGVCVGKQCVTSQNGLGIAINRVDCRCSPAQGSVVYDIVVHEGCRVQHLKGAGKAVETSSPWLPKCVRKEGRAGDAASCRLP